AAAYCQQLGISLADYFQRLESTNARLLASERDAAHEYRSRFTVAKTFALAIDAASKRHAAAEPLLVHAAMLPPAPLPLFLLAAAGDTLGEPLASAFAGDSLDRALAALRAFGLAELGTVADERGPAIKTDCVRLHWLVHQVAQARCEDAAGNAFRRAMIAALRDVYPERIHDSAAWSRARRCEALALALVGGDALAGGNESLASELLDRLALYRYGAQADYAEARRLHERALAIRESALGTEHP